MMSEAKLYDRDAFYLAYNRQDEFTEAIGWIALDSIIQGVKDCTKLAYILYKAGFISPTHYDAMSELLIDKYNDIMNSKSVKNIDSSYLIDLLKEFEYLGGGETCTAFKPRSNWAKIGDKIKGELKKYIKDNYDEADYKDEEKLKQHVHHILINFFENRET